MIQIKALSVLQCRKYMLDERGQKGVEAIKQAMSDSARAAIYSELLLASDWIDVAFALDHGRAYDRTFGTDDGRLLMKMIREVTTENATGLYRSVFANTTPRSVLEKSSRLWPRYYSQGTSELEMQGDKRMAKRILGCPDLPRNHEWFLIAYYEALLQLTGALDVHIRHVLCVANGDKHCETLIRWK